MKMLKSLFIVVALTTLALPVNAQTKPRDALGVQGGIIGQGTSATKPLTGNIKNDAKTIWANIQSASAADLAYAAAMAAAANTPASKTRLQCLNAIIAANAQAQGLSLTGSDGKPLSKPDPHAISDIESIAELIDNLSPQGPLFTSCAGAAQMFKTNTLQLISGIVTGVAAFGAVGIP